jgi:hypothetical protein
VEVEAHGVERRRRRDDHGRVRFAGQPFELLAEVTADALRSVSVAHLEEGELRDSRPDVRPDNPDPPRVAHSQTLPVQFRLRRDRARTRRAEIAEPPLEPVAVLRVEGVDLFGSIDLADPLEVCGDEPAVRDLVDSLRIGVRIRTA